MSWRVVLGLGLLGLALGFGWGIADQPTYRASAGVAVESDSQGSDRARLERFAQRGESRAVATTAAALLGGDVSGADLLADVAVRPVPEGGALIVTADSRSPDYAAAAAEAWAEALVEVEGDPLAVGAAAEIPTAPFENRSAALWSAIGLLAGLLVGIIVAAALMLSGRGRLPGEEGEEPSDGSGPGEDDHEPSPLPEPDPDPDPAAPDPVPEAGPVGEAEPGPPVLGSVPSPALAIVLAADGTVVADPADLVGLRPVGSELGFSPGGGPGTLAVATVGDDDAGARVGTVLALLAADAGMRVLLVETDFEAPVVAGLLGIEADPGLGDYLIGAAGPRDVVRSVRASIGEDGAAIDIACIPAGGSGGEASVAGPRFAGLAERLSRIYELVVYVAPPAATAEAGIVTRLVGSTVLAAGVEVSADDSDGAVRSLEGAEIDGLVVCEA